MSDSRAFNLDVADCAQGSHWSGHLPPAVQSAIQTKLEEEQKALEMQFVRERTRQEAVRKQIEATGIAGYQSIISKRLERSGDRMEGNRGGRKIGGVAELQSHHRRLRQGRAAGYREHFERHTCAGGEPLSHAG